MSSPFSKADINTIRLEDSAYPEQVWYTIAAFLFVKTAVTNGVHHKFSLHRIPLAIINFYRVVAFRWTLEIGQSYTLNMAEVFVTVAYIALLLIYAFINTTSAEGQKLDIDYWSRRTGMLAASQFPIVTALGTKNNIVSWVTGISYDRLNYIHRMMARTCFMLLWVHAAGEVLCYPSFRETLDVDWLRLGIAAMVAFSILILVSLRPVRNEVYEVFFYIHFLGVLIFLVGGYYHVLGSQGAQVYWIWPSFVVWAFDRFVRAVRLVVFNHSYFGFKSGTGTMDAETELLSEDVIRLRLRRPSHFHWSPGQTAYLIMPSAHPFTIASFDPSLLSTVSAEDQSSSEVMGSSVPFWKELVFFINVQEGFTKKLKEVAAKKETVKVFVDGPYGPSPDLGSYDTSVLVAGRSCIVSRVRKGKSSCTRVVFIWSIRGAEFVKWIEEALIKAVQLAPPSLTVSIRIFITASSPATQSNSSGEENSSVSSSTEKKDSLVHAIIKKHSLSLSFMSLHGVRMETGRPNIDALLKEEVGVTSGRMSVSVCGSQAIARSVRHALRFPVSGPSSILSGGPSVTLHIESFGYA
ncbi:ferric reductase like transmembrane component-domain-containing protein [Suillus subalutaceus]|uniref:ferric reductase like transmembrane component-domain-containing protein n=1 Tax=Suillus subalutaceus TaxID=48586 RepID=UPI001B86A4FC|nr:ferric reductase like transmembrane component-domain-containing protein [Suillus subalutaceus]KAG1856390.1 ferric reductase like transmembrane component-domain-containing protein [Suillus subalutaceus]